MSVYFITARSLNRVKIGHTNGSLRQRLSHINLTSPVEIQLEAAMEGGKDIEAALHVRFSAHRKKGEWFEITPEIERLIASNPIGGKAQVPSCDVERLIAICGSQSKMARRLGVPVTTVANWRKSGRIPHWRVASINSLLGERA